MNYDKIAESVIKSAVSNHLRGELKAHCQGEAKKQAKLWLQKNKKELNKAIGEAVSKRLDAEKKAITEKAVKGIKVRTSNTYRYY